jgi:hypothetical protein
MKYLILFINLFVLITVAQSQTCKKLPSNFNSYEEAVTKVRNATFKIEEEKNFDSDCWIIKASYYSCVGNSGYMIYITREQRKTYIHKNLPLWVWKEFINSSNPGSYYTRNIRGNYQLKI